LVRKSKKNIDPLDSSIIKKILLDLEQVQEGKTLDNIFLQLMRWLKGTKQHSAVLRIDYLIQLVKKEEHNRLLLSKLVQYLFHHKDFTSLFTDIGVLNSSSFFSELSNSITKKILPDLRDKDSMKALLEMSLVTQRDFKNINSIPNKLWIELFSYIGNDIDIKSSGLAEQILDSISILSFRVLSFAYEDKVSPKWKASKNQYNELLKQNQEINWLVHMLKEGRFDHEAIDAQFEVINNSIAVCKNVISDIKHNSVLYGTSLEQSYAIAKIEQQLNRIKNLLELLKSNSKPEQLLNIIVVIFNKVLQHIYKEKKVTYVISESAGLLAYQISEHKRETGEHYITSSKSEYWTLFWSSIKGGLIICIAAWIKVLLHSVDIAPFWSYFLYGLNYALAFCIMYLTHATLATKQPAMTAAALAHAMDHKSENFTGSSVSITLAQVWRSQFISFVGNLIVVFPICMVIAMLWNFVTFEHLMHPYDYAESGLIAQHPFMSLAWFYACITGVFLFLSGIISGYVDNKVIYGNIPARIKAHPFLKTYVSDSNVNSLSNFVREHLGSIVGNVFLGFALGYAPFIGELFGIPFDIRHITISTAYLGFGVVGTEFSWAIMDYLLIALGVVGIGAFNFSISFGLAFLTAMSSRNVPLSNVKYYFRFVKKHLSKYPLDFIYPPKRKRVPEDLM